MLKSNCKSIEGIVSPKPSQEDAKEGISKVSDSDLETFLASIGFDQRLFKVDIEGSLAHVKMLVKQGILAQDDGETILKGLQELLTDHKQGSLVFSTQYEDIHMNIEAALVEKIGDLGGAMHIARSRNDQVALDMRLYIRGEIDELLTAIDGLQKILTKLAEENSSTIVPGYTHLQHAQPVLLSKHLMAHYWKLERDKERMQDCLIRVNVNPLGSCALAGTTLPIDREYTTKLLGLSKACQNSLDAVSDRDFVAETAFCCSMVMTHLSGICEELILWSTLEFGYVKFAEGLTTGSSIMPQKKNPDIAELVRGKTGRVNGNLIALLTILKGLPLAYNKDLQEDKEAIFDSLDTVKGSLAAMSMLFAGIEFTIDQGSVFKTLEDSFSNATELADHLAQQGIPYRSAYNITKQVVAYCQENGKTLSDLDQNEMSRLTGLDIDIATVVNITAATKLKMEK